MLIFKYLLFRTTNEKAEGKMTTIQSDIYVPDINKASVWNNSTEKAK